MVNIFVVKNASDSKIHFWHFFKLFLDGELVYRDPYGGLSILVMETSTVKVLMTNTTFVSWILLSLLSLYNSLTHWLTIPTETVKCRKVHSIA